MFPGRLEYELEELEAVGISVALDDNARAQRGVVRLELSVPAELSGADVVELIATFPDAYPFQRPDVVAPGLSLGHHQHPFGKNLCLVGRSSRMWQPSDTLAWLLRSQLHATIRAGVATASDGPTEEQGEPFSDYYATYVDGAAFLVDSAWEPPIGTSGDGALTVRGTMPSDAAPSRLLISADRLTTFDGSAFELPEEIRTAAGHGTRIRGRWTVLSAPVRVDDAQSIWEAAADADPSAVPVNEIDGRKHECRAVAFPEEHGPGRTGTGWVLVVRTRGQVIAPSKAERRSRNPARAAPKTTPDRYQLIRAVRCGAQDMRARTVSTAPLLRGRVLLIGVGALGSVLANNLARAGVGAITLIDPDVLEPGNLARHASGFHHVGLSKAHAVASAASEANPFVKVAYSRYALGGPMTSHEERRALQDMFASADIVVDATAEVGVEELSAHLARLSSKPWVMLEATNGGWGGSVVHVPADGEWCFACFQLHRIDGAIPTPPADPAGLVQPAGCADPTFTGFGHDLAEVALQGTRTVVAALTGSQVLDAAVLRLHSADAPPLPAWSSHRVPAHGRCTHGG